jgi:hypothetical protein
MMVYVIKKDTDMIEGKGAMVIDKIFSNREGAIEYFTTRPNPYGGFHKMVDTGQNHHFDGFYSFDGYYVYEKYTPEEELKDKRNKILAKLSKEEREILGV